MNLDQIIKSVADSQEVKEIETACEVTLTHGCCFDFAEALVKVFGGKLWVVASRENPTEDWGDLPWATEHVFAEIGGRYYDGSGEVTLEQMEKFTVREPKKVAPKARFKGLWYPMERAIGFEEQRVFIQLLRRHSK